MPDIKFHQETFTSSTPAALIVDLGALQNNYRILCEDLKPDIQCAPVVKANGYGLGMLSVAESLWNMGAQTFFVAQVQEGIELRQALPQAQIYVFSTLVAGDQDALCEHQLIPVLCQEDQLYHWHQHALKLNQKLPCAIHIDTGLVRTGFQETALQKISPKLFEFLDLKLILSHLACPYSPEHPMNQAQLVQFQRLVSYLPPAPRSLANSGGICLGPDYHFDMVRPGLSLYGSTLTSSRFQPVVHIFAQIVQIEDLPTGTSIGYDTTFKTLTPSRIATLAIGYADGLLRSLSNNGYVFANNQRFPIVGRISMDLMTIDITEEHAPQLQCGDWVEISGANILLDELAIWSGTAPWEILTNLGSRYSRFYAKKNSVELEKAAS